MTLLLTVIYVVGLCTACKSDTPTRTTLLRQLHTNNKKGADLTPHMPDAKTNKLATQNILDNTNQIDNQKIVPENLPLHDTVQPRKISD